LAAEARPWPVEAHTAEVARRAEAAALVRAQVERLRGPHPVGADTGLTAEEAARVQVWDDELERLLEEARAGHAGEVEVALPSSLSATSLARLRDDPESLAADLGRPMPRKPSPAARFGTRFHSWLESRFGQQQLVGLDELPGRGDAGIEDERELEELVARFTAGPFGDRVPHAVEPPFALVLGGQVVRGRIDAVYATDEGFLVVDWKTNRRQTADPLQLAIYRVAWADLAGVPPERVTAAFFYVRSGELVEHQDLPGREELEAIVAGR
ncbi:MAG TPA: PD-(D/E)XK nuclease family protein, partial [Nocardioidaceae bacterium]